MTKNARDGYFNGGRVPFGYSAVPEGKRKRLTILEDEAQIVREIFDLYVAGMGCKLIAVQLNE
ncbi:recombinase family protein, partial [Nitrosovibrio sp. Nv17]|uniref:recombinase family protein n=1 Tax=Nitrosovibrio sp. Nv17 TaxID=1855339 RepID=UPI0009089661